MKKQEKQKQKIKEVLLKILHIVSYVLSLAFIGLCILTGVQSCSNKPKSKGYRELNNINMSIDIDSLEGLHYYLECKYEGTTTLPYQPLLQSALDNNIPSTTIYGADEVRYDYNLEGLYIIQNGELVRLYSVTFVYHSYGLGFDTQPHFILNMCYFWGNNNNFVAFQVESDWNNPSAIPCSFQQNFKLIFGDDFDFDQHQTFYNAWVKPFCNVIDINLVDFTFNYSFNYNAPIGAMIDNSIYYIEDFNTTEYKPFTTKNIDCVFYVNGEIYNQIRFTYYRANDNFYYYDDFGRITLWEGTTNDPHGYFHDMKFVNTIDNKQVEVYRRKIYSQYEQGYSLVDNGGYWVSNYYQHITLLGTNDALNLTLSKLNNTERATTGVSGGGYGDMFGLLTSAFTSLLPILNISIIPGITLGLLLFIPLIVILISVVVRLIKK